MSICTVVEKRGERLYAYERTTAYNPETKNSKLINKKYLGKVVGEDKEGNLIIEKGFNLSTARKYEIEDLIEKNTNLLFPLMNTYVLGNHEVRRKEKPEESKEGGFTYTLHLRERIGSKFISISFSWNKKEIQIHANPTFKEDKNSINILEVEQSTIIANDKEWYIESKGKSVLASRDAHVYQLNEDMILRHDGAMITHLFKIKDVYYKYSYTCLSKIMEYIEKDEQYLDEYLKEVSLFLPKYLKDNTVEELYKFFDEAERKNIYMINGEKVLLPK